MTVSVCHPRCVSVSALMGTHSPGMPEQPFEVGTELLLVSYRPEKAGWPKGILPAQHNSSPLVEQFSVFLNKDLNPTGMRRPLL